MKQSKRVREASRRALDKLSRITGAELGQRLAARELDPVGQLILTTGSLKAILCEKEAQ